MLIIRLLSSTFRPHLPYLVTARKKGVDFPGS